MENEYFLVKWINEVPIRFTIMQRSDMSDHADKRMATAKLLNSEAGFKWKKKTCFGLVVKMGNKIYSNYYFNFN